MTSIPILLFGAALHLLATILWLRHMRAERRRQVPGVIGTHPLLTEVLHRGLVGTRDQQDLDWLNPQTMRNKIAAWKRKLREEGRDHD